MSIEIRNGYPFILIFLVVIDYMEIYYTIMKKWSCIFIVLLLVSCGTSIPVLQTSSAHNDLVIWAHSDMQPRTESQKVQYETAFHDVRKNIPSVNTAIVAGDLVWRDNLPEDYYGWMHKLRKNSGIPYWFEIAGNHDLNDRDAYLQFTSCPMHYAVTYGNTVFIFMSDEIRSAVTDISPEAFRWWRDLVIKFQDHNIIVITHASLNQSKLMGTINSTMTIKDSKRFYRVLKKYHVDIWLSAHTHLPNILRGKWHRGSHVPTLFVDISGINKTTFSPIESWILHLRNGMREVIMYPRNHEKEIHYKTQKLVHSLRYPFTWDGNAPVMVSSIPWQPAD